jgi:uncharacterized protein
LQHRQAFFHRRKMSLLATIAGLATGLALGLFGSGGSIIALPALLHLLHVDPKSAIAMSLGMVAVTATVSGLDNWHRGLVDVRVALVFGLFGVAGTFAGARLGLLTPVVLQLGLFALVMYAAAWRMLKPAKVVAAASGGIVNTGGGTAYHGARWHTATKSGNFLGLAGAKPAPAPGHFPAVGHAAGHLA